MRCGRGGLRSSARRPGVIQPGMTPPAGPASPHSARPDPGRAPLLPPSAFSAAAIAALVGFGSTVALVVQAGLSVGGTPDQIASMVTALCIGMAVAGGGLSLAFRMPIVLAWSTSGAALIAASTLGIDYPTAVGTFVAAGALTVLLGLLPALSRLAERIPGAVAAAMLAGVLLPFCIGLFRTFETDWTLAGLLLVVYLAARQRFPAYALLVVLVAAIGMVLARGQVSAGGAAAFGTLAPVVPVFDWRAVVSLGVPLFLVTLVSQNLPGFVVLRTSGYEPPPRPVLMATGAATMILAPFGAFSVNLAAITAAICTGPDAHPDPRRRWLVGMLYAGCYALLALFSAPLVGLFTAMPAQTVAAIAGVALIGPLTNAMGAMLADPDEREAAILTFVATASGMTLLGIGAAFWGLVVGFAALAAKRIMARGA